jgi:hypothetical protein
LPGSGASLICLQSDGGLKNKTRQGLAGKIAMKLAR